MKTFSRSALTLLISLSVGLAAAQINAAPLTDRVDRPSHLTANAAQFPLIDIQSINDRQVMVGESGHILLWTADGKIKQVDVPVDLLLTAVHFVDPQNGWVVGHDGVVLHSTDGGQHWIKQIDGRDISKTMQVWAESALADAEKASEAAPDDEDLEIALDNAYFALDDVEAGSEAGPSRPLLDVWFRDVNEGWAVGAYGMFIHTTDGGSTWNYVAALPNPDRMHLNTVLGLTDSTLLVGGEGGRMYRSQDNGQSWTASRNPSQASIYKILELKDGSLLALGFGGELLNSQDQGASWTDLQSQTRVSLYNGTQLADGSVLLAGQRGTLLYSRDGKHFNVWKSKSSASWLGVAESSPQKLMLIGSKGLQRLSLSELKEQLQ
ncbi:MAG: hypothetical protein CMK72_13780 [Pseudomonadaceae bacterium]|nr:hypothetical protein [Pseudomonadaceae bacterium]HCP55479.1 hypothetical protein [Pseudomonas sp.]